MRRRRAAHGWRAVVVGALVGAVVGVLVPLGGAAGATDAATDAGGDLAPAPPETAAADPAPDPGALDLIAERMLTVQPGVGETWVLPIGGMPTGQQVLARTLQGIVNRTEARLYLVDPSDAGAQRWLDTFQAQGLVTVAGTTDLAGAVDRFGAEASGYVLADPAEAWGVQTAATIAAAEGAVVATPAEVPLVEAAGLTLIEDVRGRWTDAASAYEAIADEYADALPHAGVAVLRPDDRGLDFAVQQGMLVLFTRPDAPDWPRISALIRDRPAGTPVFGYLSDTGEEEGIAVGTLAASGLVLVPSDTVRNLSFQVAVGADRPREVIAPPDLDDVAPCTPDTLNVVAALTDGDNVNVPLNTFSSGGNWASPSRGDLPLGWSITPSLAVLAPAAWDAYVREATANDELVGMIGWAYGSPSLLPDPQGFYGDSFGLMDLLGQRTFWSLGGGLETPGVSGWRALDAAAATTASGVPDGVLVGYGGGSGVGRAFASPAGRPALTSGTAYRQTPAQIAAQVEALLAMPADQRPIVSFLAATNWSNPAGALIDALEPFVARGVRFLTPAEAAACIPEASEPPPPVAGPDECLPAGVPVQSGLALISDAAAADMVRVPTPSAVEVAVDAPSTVAPGGGVAYTATATIDLPALADSVLEERVRPIVSAGYGAELAAGAWLELELSDAVVRMAAPEGTTPAGDPAVTAGSGSAAWTPEGVELTIPGPVAADSRASGSATTVEVAWTVTVPPDTAAEDVVLPAVEIAFDLDLTIGVLLGTLGLTGSAAAPWACTPADEPAARTAVVVPRPDLRISGGAQADETGPGLDTPHLFTAVNAGEAPARDATVVLTLPEGTEATVATHGWLSRPCAIDGATVTCRVGTIPVGGARFVAVTTRSQGLGPVEVVATAASADPDAVPADDTTTSRVEVVAVPGAPDLSPSISSAPLVAGQEATILVGVHRTGPRSATGVEVRVEVPEGVDLVSATRGWFGVRCAVTGRTATCTIPRVTADTFLLVTVRPTAAGPVSVSATVTADEDADPGNDTATAELAAT